MITDTINSQIHEAMKSGDKIRLSTLRLLASALSYEKISKQAELTPEEEIAVVRQEAKKRNDAIEVYEKVGSKDRVEIETEELAILKELLPPDISDEELDKIVSETITTLGAKTMSDMGRTIGEVVKKYRRPR